MFPSDFGILVDVQQSIIAYIPMFLRPNKSIQKSYNMNSTITIVFKISLFFLLKILSNQICHIFMKGVYLSPPFVKTSPVCLNMPPNPVNPPPPGGPPLPPEVSKVWRSRRFEKSSRIWNDGRWRDAWSDDDVTASMHGLLGGWGRQNVVLVYERWKNKQWVWGGGWYGLGSIFFEVWNGMRHDKKWWDT